MTAKAVGTLAGLYIGTSGWHYRDWVGTFYPPGCRPEDFLAYYAARFATAEIDSTFYRLPAAETVAAWRDQTPPGFRFACKASRYITHMKKLRDPAESTRRFFTTIEALGDRLGPILFQLPLRWRADPPRLEAFLAALPEGPRYAFEFREPGWFAPAVLGRLAAHGAACCLHDWDRREMPLRVTADFVYFRLHGPEGGYRGRYDDKALAAWAERILTWRKAGLEVYGYFNNDAGGNAVKDARRLLRLLGEAGRRREGGARPGAVIRR